VKGRKLEKGKIEVTCRTGQEELYMTTIIVHYQYWYRKRKPKNWHYYLIRRHKDIAEHIKKLNK